jgi:dipeptidyl aminopeptidase/acylaminoacyl peptidase
VRSLGFRLLRALAIGLSLSAVLVLSLPFGAGAGLLFGITLPGCGTTPDPAARGLAYRTVSFPSSEFAAPVRAYFFPPALPPPAPVIIAAPTGSVQAADRIEAITTFLDAGYAVLAHDGRGCVAPAAADSLGYRDAALIEDAYAYLVTEANALGIDPMRIGVHGFSAGGAAALLATARLPDAAGGIDEGSYYDFDANLFSDTQTLGLLAPLFRAGAVSAYRLATGDPIEVLDPYRAIPMIAPRPLLLVYGTAEPGLAGGRLMLDAARAAGSDAELLELAGVGHGDYPFVAPEPYHAALRAFWARVFGV